MDNSKSEDPFPYPALYVTLMHCGTAISLPLTILAVYCILRKSPTTIKSYSKLLLNHVIWAALSECILNAGSTPVIFLPHMAGYPAGLLNYLGLTTHQQLCIAFVILFGTAASIIHLFIYRCYAILPEGHFIRRVFRKRAVEVFIYAYCFLPAIPEAVLILQDQKVVKELAKKTLHPLPLNLDDPRVVVYMIEGNTALVVALTHIFVLIFLGVVSCFSLSVYSMYILRKRSISMSKRTSQMQRTYLFALCFQMTVYAAVLVGPAFFIMLTMVMGYRNMEFCNYLIFVLSLNGAAGTIAMLIINKPYRTAISNILYPVGAFLRIPICSPHTYSEAVSVVTRTARAKPIQRATWGLALKSTRLANMFTNKVNHVPDVTCA